MECSRGPHPDKFYDNHINGVLFSDPIPMKHFTIIGILLFLGGVVLAYFSAFYDLWDGTLSNEERHSSLLSPGAP